MDNATRVEAIRSAAIAALNGTEVGVEDVTVHPAGKRRLVRVIVTRDLSVLPPDDHASIVAPLSLDEIADATRAVSAELDRGDSMGQLAYTLEVTSPGADQPLRTPPQFRRNVGRRLSVELQEGPAVTGRLMAAGPSGLRLAVTSGAGHDTTELDYAQVARATVQLEFNRPEGEVR